MNSQDKSPISFLQETMVRQGCMPVYTFIIDSDQIQPHIFKCRVTCKNNIAEGTALNKKAAKHNAALQMLKSLNIPFSDDITPYIQEDRSTLSRDDKTATCSNTITISHTPTTITFYNYVGKLEEISRIFKVSPVYTMLEMNGPPHKPTFTCSCKIESMKEIVTGSTKKEAKQFAAKKMLERLNAKRDLDDKLSNMFSKLVIDNASNNIEAKSEEQPLEEILSNLDIPVMELKMKNYEEELNLQSSKIDKAVTFYKNTKKTDLKVGRDVPITECHLILENECKNIISDGTRHALNIWTRDSEPLHYIAAIERVIKDTFKIENIGILSKDKDLVLVGLKVLTTPPMVQIGLGKNTKEATEQAFLNIANTLLIMIA